MNRIIFLIALFFSAQVFALTSYSANKLAYQTAIIHSAMHELHPAPLIQVSSEKSCVTMVTWTNGSYHLGNQKLHSNVWVVETTEMQKTCSRFSRKNRPLRIEELLGMPPLHDYHRWHMVIMLVPNKQANIDDVLNHQSVGIFRPCFSNGSIRSSVCTYQFKQDDKNYDVWLLRLSEHQYRLSHGYPWTGLGYTYNWNPKAKSIVGLSEFIVTKGTPVRVLKIESANQLCGIS